jgi:hypothetical protein
MSLMPLMKIEIHMGWKYITLMTPWKNYTTKCMTCPYLLDLTFIYIRAHDQYSINASTNFKHAMWVRGQLRAFSFYIILWQNKTKKIYGSVSVSLFLGKVQVRGNLGSLWELVESVWFKATQTISFCLVMQIEMIKSLTWGIKLS